MPTQRQKPWLQENYSIMRILSAAVMAKATTAADTGKIIIAVDTVMVKVAVDIDAKILEIFVPRHISIIKANKYESLLTWRLFLFVLNC